MCEQPKEGAGRPLYESAPKIQPEIPARPYLWAAAASYLLAWLYVCLREDIAALRQENIVIEQSLKQQAVLLEATGKEFVAWKERNEHIIESYANARKDLCDILSSSKANSDFGTIVVPDDVLSLLNDKSCSPPGGDKSTGSVPAGKRNTSPVR